MGAFDHSTASLRIFGDDLVPDEVTQILGCTPTMAYLKGQPRRPGSKHCWRFGGWLLDAEDAEPEDLEAQINYILDQINPDLNVWREQILARFEVNFFCGLFMKSGNDGFELQPATMRRLAERELEIGFDVYDHEELEVTFNAAAVTDLSSFHDQCQQTFKLHSSYGRDWESLFQCLDYFYHGRYWDDKEENNPSDLYVENHHCLEIIITDYVAFAARLPDIASKFLETIVAVNKSYEERSICRLQLTLK